MGPAFYLRTIPTLALMLASTAGGWALGMRLRGAAVTALAIAGGLLCLAGVWTYQRREWAPGLLLGLSAAVGLLVARLNGLGDASSAWVPALAAMIAMTAGALTGRSLRRFLRGVYGPVWVAAWLVILAAVGLQLAGAPMAWTVFTAKAVLAIFFLLSAAWFARLEGETQALAALDLYLIGITLFLSLTVLRVTG
ncbi:MAG TPA: hypothetical protein VLD63_09435 [Anaerolineales bacterium]|nr:hypothetical protein [Anaerolineales bacterium]